MIIYIFHIIQIIKTMHFVFFCLIFYFTFSNEASMFPFLSMKNTFLDCKQYVGAGIGTLMSISDGFGPFIFCRKMEKARPMTEEMDGKVVYFPPESAFFTLMV